MWARSLNQENVNLQHAVSWKELGCVEDGAKIRVVLVNGEHHIFKKSDVARYLTTMTTSIGVGR